MQKHNIMVKLTAEIEREGAVGVPSELQVEAEGNPEAMLQLLVIGYLELAKKILKAHSCDDCPFARSTKRTVEALKALNHQKFHDFMETEED